MTNSPYVGIDLFAGAGGLSYGLSQAGFDMRIGIELDSHTAITLRKNHENMNVVVSDIKAIKPLEIINSFDLQPGDIDLVAGGPPCRGFSQSNRVTRNLGNPLNNLYKDFFRFIKELQPEAFLLENVAGLRTLNKGVALRDILDRGKKMGYHVQWEIVNAEEFGVPQRRKRIMFIGTKDKLDILVNGKISKTVTVKEAISDLPILRNGNTVNDMNYGREDNLSSYQKHMRKGSGKRVSNNLVTRNNELVLQRYKHISPGGNWRNIPPNLMSNYKNLNNCHTGIYHRLRWEKSSIVISNFRKNMLVHPEQNRGLSVREAARLQSFPDNYIFYGPLGSQQQQVANAVPPLLAKYIGERIYKMIDGRKNP